jgi:hypothetical protein
MNQHLAASYSLSVMIVVFFAIALYRADPPSQPSRTQPVASKEKADSGSVSRSDGKPSIAGTEPRAEAASRAGVEPSIASRVEAIRGPAVSNPPQAPGSVVRQVSRASTRPGLVRKGAFTIIEGDETLEDVAIRVYGSADSAVEIWRSNRDQLPTRETPTRAGMVLRTP